MEHGAHFLILYYLPFPRPPQGEKVAEWAASSPSAATFDHGYDAYDHRPMRSPDPPRQQPDWLGAALPPRPPTPPRAAAPVRRESRPELGEEGSYVVL